MGAPSETLYNANTHAHTSTGPGKLGEVRRIGRKPGPFIRCPHAPSDLPDRHALLSGRHHLSRRAHLWLLAASCPGMRPSSWPLGIPVCGYVCRHSNLLNICLLYNLFSIHVFSGPPIFLIVFLHSGRPLFDEGHHQDTTCSKTHGGVSTVEIWLMILFFFFLFVRGRTYRLLDFGAGLMMPSGSSPLKAVAIA